MKILESSFTTKGWHFEQVQRNGDIAIYRRWKDNGLPAHFETIKIESHNGYEIGGKWIEPAESYPSEKSWGTKGFTFHTLAEAQQRALSLSSPEKEPATRKTA